jgi:hypothetical protein
MGLFDKDALTGGFMTTVIKDVVRGMLNRALKETTPKQLVAAIQDDTSLWGVAAGDINSYVKTLPSPVAAGLADARKIVETQYGGFDVLVLKWLEEDHALYYNIIVNTPGGKGTDWLKKQIYDILDGVQNANG